MKRVKKRVNPEPFECWVRHCGDDEPQLFSAKTVTFHQTGNWKRLKWDAASLGWAGELHGNVYSVPREAMRDPGEALFWSPEPGRASGYISGYIIETVESTHGTVVLGDEWSTQGVTLEELFAEGD